MTVININDNQRNGKIYDGNTRKFGVTINNRDFIVKFAKKNDMSVYSEYIASNFIASLGIPCHKVFLGNYKGEIVDVMIDFTKDNNASLHSFKDTKQSSEDTELTNKEYAYDDVIYLIDKHLKMTDSDKLEAKKQFWNMFICDAIIGNRDKHWDNWGYLEISGKYKFAPLYDNGAGLFPGVNKVMDQYVNIYTRKNFLYDRVFVFPASLFKIQRQDRSYRSNYKEMFSDLRTHKLLAQQVRQIKEKVSYRQVFDIMQVICKTVPLEVYYRRFYIEITTLRYMCIILRLDFDKSYNLLERALKNYG